MSRSLLLVTVIALLCGAGLWFARGGHDPSPPPAPTSARPPTAADTAVGPDVAAPAAHDRTPVPDGGIADTTAGPPVPATAPQVDVLVVDAVTKAPVPGAEVCWYDRGIVEAWRRAADTTPDDPLLLDPEKFGATRGWRTVTDARGLAHVHLGQRTVVTARHGARFGRLDLDAGTPAPPAGFRLELATDAVVDVQVLDAAGTPAVGVAVAIAASDDLGRTSLIGFGALAVTRAPDGVARIPHLQLLRTGDRRAPHVRTYLPGFDDPGQPLDLDAPPAAPIVLRLPPTGSLRARVAIADRTPRAVVFELGENLPTFHRVRPGLFRRPDADGWVRFAHVPLGKEYVVGARVDGGDLTQLVKGPVVAGVEVDVVLSPSAGQAILTGRLVDADRAPITDCSFRLQIRGNLLADTRLETDASGRFLAVLDSPGERQAISTIVVLLQRDGERPLAARPADRELRAGTEELGDLVLLPEPLAVAGRCTIDGAPAPLPEGVRVEQLEDDGGERQWRRCELRRWLGDDGAFELRGVFGPGAMRLVVTGDDFLAAAPIEFEPGAAGLRLDLRSGSRLTASLLVPAGCDTQLTARLVPTGNAERLPRMRTRTERRGDRLLADWRGIPAGTYHLEFSIDGIRPPVHRVDDVTVPAPAGGDPRLADIDLRDALRVLSVRVLGADGAPLRHAPGGVFVGAIDPQRRLVGFGFEGDTATFLLPREVPEVTVAIQGFRPIVTACSDRPVDVRLSPWPRATLTFAGLELPEGISLQARLELPEPDGDAPSYRAGWQRGLVADLCGAPTEWHAVVDGTVELMVDDTPRRIRLELRGRGTSHVIEAPVPGIDITTPAVRIELPPEALQQALDAVRRPGR